jgi:hypothetical protein
MNCSIAHHKLFGLGVPGAMAALRGPVPSKLEYPDACAREYAEIAISKLRQTSGMRVGWPPFIEQGLRLLILERIFKARAMPIPFPMQKCVEDVQKSSEIMATLKRG